MKTEAKYKFIGMNGDGKTVNINLTHAAKTADTTKMKTLLDAFGAAADTDIEIFQIDHIKTETTSVETD